MNFKLKKTISIINIAGYSLCLLLIAIVFFGIIPSYEMPIFLKRLYMLILWFIIFCLAYEHYEHENGGKKYD